ncbi:MAG: hypothetical protein K2M34_02795 [Alphaproteobacteria bacterium]|nr:hypothetical protein [Alphaproteobacteria bacterium]
MDKISKFKMAVKSALISAVAVPAMWVASHFVNGGTFKQNDATLSERFQCAYTLNPKNDTYISYEYRAPDDYRYYEDEDGQRRFIGDYGDLLYSESWIEQGGEYDKICVPEKYFAHPFVTYPMYLAVAGLAYAGMRRRRQKNVAQMDKQKTR